MGVFFLPKPNRLNLETHLIRKPSNGLRSKRSSSSQWMKIEYPPALNSWWVPDLTIVVGWFWAARLDEMWLGLLRTNMNPCRWMKADYTCYSPPTATAFQRQTPFSLLRFGQQIFRCQTNQEMALCTHATCTTFRSLVQCHRAISQLNILNSLRLCEDSLGCLKNGKDGQKHSGSLYDELMTKKQWYLHSIRSSNCWKNLQRRCMLPLRNNIGVYFELKRCHLARMDLYGGVRYTDLTIVWEK